MIALIGKGKKFTEEALKFKERMRDEDIEIFGSYEDLGEDIKDAEIILNGQMKIDYEALKKAEKLKMLMTYSAGVDYVDGKFFKERGIKLLNSSGVHVKNIAEQLMGAMIYFSRNLHEAVKAKNEGVWRQKEIAVDELEGKKLLIIGAGHIGQELARKAAAFDMEIYGVRNTRTDRKVDNFKEIFKTSDLDEHLSGMDYVVLIVPLTKDTEKMMGKKQFELMDETAVFMNIGRGPTVDQNALFDALEKKEIKAAYLDVFEEEPVPESCRCWKIDNLLMTPHNGGMTPHYDRRIFTLFEEAVRSYRHGEDPKNQVDLSRMY